MILHIYKLKINHFTHKQSTPKISLLIILSPGVDPVVSQVLIQVADAYSKNLVLQVALGQGQGTSAVKAIEEACVSGDWVFLANCHLMPTWMNDELEAVIAICEATGGKYQQSF